MKIIHTADWHLGAKLENRDRILEQETVLNELSDICDREDVSIVIISGDIFHTKQPSSEAEDLFFRSVEKLSNHNNRVVFIIPGNHDDGERLGASRPLAEKHNIILATSLDNFVAKKINREGENYVMEAGKGYVKIKAQDEDCTLAFLPFISLEKAKEEAKDASCYADAVKFLLEFGTSHFSDSSLNICVGHLFVVGALMGDNKEVKVGDVMAVGPDVFSKNAHYVALGHLHRSQKIKDNIYYPGSIIELRFKDERPSVLLLDANKGGVKSVQKIPLKTAKNLIKIKASSVASAYKELSLNNKDDLVELTITSSVPLKSQDIKELRKIFPNIVTLNLELISEDGEQKIAYNRKNLNDEELFLEFYKAKTGQTPPKGLVEMFLECKEKIDATD
ncbi:MAG: exonuclease SbcCD subunit D [Clostridia bacterium]|nr:exonuclease SbcCD subunit D [Clostridia bacterium]